MNRVDSSIARRHRRTLMWAQRVFSATNAIGGAALFGWYAYHAKHLTPFNVTVAAAVLSVMSWILQIAYAAYVVDPLSRRIEDDTRSVASRDALTGLPTRVGFGDRLTRALARYHRSGRRFALAYIDVDHFKQINDAKGHPEGDRLLRAVAARIRELVRSEDDVARLGGDEFAVIFEGVPTPEDAHEVARRLHIALAAPPDGSERIPVSIGLALASFTHRNIERLVAEADTALYTTKRRGRNGFTVSGFAPLIDRALREQRPA